MSREDRITELKQRMVAKYGSCLLPIAEDTATFPDIRKDDSPEERESKLQKKRDIIAAREAAYKQKVPEMMIELDKLIDRVKSARPELLKTGMESVYSTGMQAQNVFNLMCDQCGNRDANFVVTDNKRGDRICLGKDGRGCGAVVQDHIEVQGADRRNFEGEDDRRQFGPAPNKLLGDAANMETSLNIEVRGTGRDNAPWKRISQAHQNVEMSLSSVGKDEKHTREGYKTSHKRKAFAQLEVIASDMNIHMQVVQKAKEEFAKYREVREALHNFEGVLLACLALAFEELSPHLQFMAEKPKFTTISESAVGTDVSFGKVRPRAEVTDDVAISTVPAVAMGKFTLSQVREWLLAVSGGSGCGNSGGSGGGYETEALIVYDYIENLTNSTEASTTSTATTTTSKRDLPTSSIFGTVTVSSRLKKYGNKGTTSTTTSSSTDTKAGQHLLRVNNIATALNTNTNSTTTNNTNHTTTNNTTTTTTTTNTTHKAAEIHLREAVIRRSHYDSTLLEYERVTTLQNTRMRIEDQVSTNFQASVLQLRKPSSGGGVSGGVSGGSGVKVEGGVSGIVKVEGGNSGSNGSYSNGSSGSEKRSLEDSVEPNKRIKTEPITTNNNTSTTNTANTTNTSTNPTNTTTNTDTTSNNEYEGFDFDLEELVGGPVASVSSSRYTNVKTSTTNGANNGTSVKSANNKASVSVANVSAPKIKVEGVESSNGASSGAGEAKKVGMRPRPKFVIS